METSDSSVLHGLLGFSKLRSRFVRFGCCPVVPNSPNTAETATFERVGLLYSVRTATAKNQRGASCSIDIRGEHRGRICCP